jgi:hypothetical protein
MTARIEWLRFERAHVTEMRSVGTIEAELQRVQPSAAGVWRATSGCRDVTLFESGHACAEVLALREALGTAQRRDVLDADLDRIAAQLARLPVVTAADPQSQTAARLVNWATFGVVNIAANDFNLVRVWSASGPRRPGLDILTGSSRANFRFAPLVAFWISTALGGWSRQSKEDQNSAIKPDDVLLVETPDARSKFCS